MSRLQNLHLTPWNEFLMSFILHVTNASLTVFKAYTEKNELIQITSGPCCVCLTKIWNCSHTWLTQKLWIRSWSQQFKSSIYQVEFTQSLQGTRRHMSNRYSFFSCMPSCWEKTMTLHETFFIRNVGWTKQPFHHNFPDLFWSQHSETIQLQSITRHNLRQLLHIKSIHSCPHSILGEKKHSTRLSLQRFLLNFSALTF